MKKIFVLALLTASCSVPPSAPSVGTTPAQFAPGQCIVGTDASCVDRIPTPAPAPISAQPIPALQLSAGCTSDLTDKVTCNIDARNEAGRVWTSHIVRMDFDWGDYSTSSVLNASTAIHQYAGVRNWGIGIDVTDDRGVTTYIGTGVTTK